MAVERFSNRAQTTLNGAINNSTTSLTLTSATDFPSAPFRILIDSEIIYVGARSGTSCTSCTRGAEGTTAASHSDLATLTHIFTAGAIGAIKSDLIQSGTYANLPASGTDTGETYFFTNSFYSFARWNGSSWDHFYNGQKVTPPVDGDYSWVNQGSATTDTTYGGVVLYGPSSGSVNIRARVKTAPSAPYTIRAIFKLIGGSAADASAGICLRDSGTGKIIIINRRISDGTYRVDKYDSATAFNLGYSVTGLNTHSSDTDIKLVDNNTNRLSSAEANGIAAIQFHSVGRTDFLTADQIGYYVNTYNSVDIYMMLISFEVT